MSQARQARRKSRCWQRKRSARHQSTFELAVSFFIVLEQLFYANHSTAMNFPYAYISCPCTDISAPIVGTSETQNDEEEQERTFDPRSPRANFSLYPLEHLLFCEDCQQIRCPRCTIEEMVCWYCPSCLFEMPLSVVKSEGPR